MNNLPPLPFLPFMRDGYTGNEMQRYARAAIAAQPAPTRAQFETWFADSRRNRGAGKRPNFDKLADGTYADDHAQRHWWTWQQAQSAQPAATFSEPTILPDGSAFATASWPLPKDHWLYAPHGEWDSKRDEYAECPAPILNNSHAQAVRAAIKYAVRGATMCGKEMDFDPDAMVQNAVYALCGPANAALLPVDAQPSAEPVAWMTEAADGTPMFWPTHAEALMYCAEDERPAPLYATQQPTPRRVPLTDEQVTGLRSRHGWAKETIRAIEAAIDSEGGHPD